MMQKDQLDRANTKLQSGSLAFGAGLVCGAVFIPGMNQAVHGDLDPFIHGWPILLEAMALGATAIIAVCSGYAIAAALGLSAGLIAIMLVVGDSEYPVASVIALTIHGFLPALLGGVLGTWIRRFALVRIPKWIGANHSMNRERGTYWP